MQVLVHRVRTPVKREGAERYVRLSLVSFAATVILTRLFLGLAGYPQIGNTSLHIAHVLWGGLLLFIASLLPLILTNRWAYTVGALLSGVGVGLFIDEVGKFITQNNDYFYPPAATIIYAFFLLTVLLYFEVRRPPALNPRAELYRVLESLTEVLDHDLEPHESAALEARLRNVVSQSNDPHLVQLATSLLEFLTTEGLLVNPAPGFVERWIIRLQTLEARLFTRRRLKALLIIGLGVLGLYTFLQLAGLVLVALAPRSAMDNIVALLMTRGEIKSVQNLTWFIVHLGLEGSVGVFFLVAASLLMASKERRGIAISVYSLLFSLTAVNLLVFYLDQFKAVFSALIQFGLLLGALSYRRRYLHKPS